MSMAIGLKRPPPPRKGLKNPLGATKMTASNDNVVTMLLLLCDICFFHGAYPIYDDNTDDNEEEEEEEEEEESSFYYCWYYCC